MSYEYPAGYMPKDRADDEYNYNHNDFAIGFLEINEAEVKFYEMAIETNCFYEI